MAVRWTHTHVLEFLAQSLVSFEKEHRKQIDKHWSYFLIVTLSILRLNEWCHRRKASICLYEHENNISKRRETTNEFKVWEKGYNVELIRLKTVSLSVCVFSSHSISYADHHWKKRTTIDQSSLTIMEWSIVIDACQCCQGADHAHSNLSAIYSHNWKFHPTMFCSSFCNLLLHHILENYDSSFFFVLSRRSSIFMPLFPTTIIYQSCAN